MMEESMETHVKIPLERVGIVIGKNGEVKKLIEEMGGVELKIDGEEGDVLIKYEVGNLNFLKVKDVLYAIGRGFSPERAIKLFEDDMLMCDTITLMKMTKHDMQRIKGRIIGRDGKMREYMENVTGTMISVYGKTISTIGYSEEINSVEKAIEMLIDGSPHETVYRYLDKEKIKLRRKDMHGS
jgi:arCOG04150 universal archaeal KH domain protein